MNFSDMNDMDLLAAYVKLSEQLKYWMDVQERDFNQLLQDFIDGESTKADEMYDEILRRMAS